MGFKDTSKSVNRPSDDIPPPPSYDASASAPGPSQSPSQPTFACLLLSRFDRIRIIGFPNAIVAPLEQAISRVWGKGIQQRGPFDPVSYEWKLHGRPWSGYGVEAVPSRRLVIHILHALNALGWHLVISTDMAKNQNDKDSLIFRHGRPVQRTYFSISFYESDKIRLIDSPQPGVTEGFIRAINTWPIGIQEQKEKEPGCLQFKLRGNPWYTSDGTEVNHARLLGMTLLSAFEAQGYELVTSVDIGTGQSGDENLKMDTWFFGSRVEPVLR